MLSSFIKEFLDKPGLSSSSRGYFERSDMNKSTRARFTPNPLGNPALESRSNRTNNPTDIELGNPASSELAARKSERKIH